LLNKCEISSKMGHSNPMPQYPLSTDLDNILASVDDLICIRQALTEKSYVCNNYFQYYVTLTEK